MIIKDPQQFDKARLEDTLMNLLYSKYKDLVFHGGTSIWRCYSGNRFSRDLDFYFKPKGDDRSIHLKEVDEFLKDCGFAMKSRSYDNVTDTMHFLVEADVKMKVDMNFKYKEGIPVDYRKVDDSFITVISLSPEDLVNEKMDAYENKLSDKNKGTEIQDLYDIYHLTTVIKKKDHKTKKRVAKLLDSIENNPPGNIRSLDHLILSGIAPTYGMMLDKIKRWVNDDKQ